MKFVKIIITMLMLSLSFVAVANAITVEMLSDVTMYAPFGNGHEYFSLDGVMSEVTDVSVIAHIYVIHLPTLMDPEIGEVIQCGIRLGCRIAMEVPSYPYPSINESVELYSLGEMHVDTAMYAYLGYDFMTLGDVLDASVGFTPIPPYPAGWYTIDVGEVYVDYIEFVIDGVLPTTQTSFGGVKMLFR